MPVFSTGVILNPLDQNGARETTKVTIQAVNKSPFISATVKVEGYKTKYGKELFTFDTFQIQSLESVTREFFADVEQFEFVIITSGESTDRLEVSLFNGQQNNLLLNFPLSEGETLKVLNSPDSPRYVEVVNNNAANPLLIKEVNSFEDPSVSNSQATQSARKGRYFAATSDDFIIFGGGFAVLELINPPDSPDTISIERVSAGTPLNTLISFYLNATIIDPTEEATPVNSIAGYPRESRATVNFQNYLEEPVISGTLINTFLQSGIGGIQFIEYQGRIIIPPGNSFLYLMSNLSIGGVFPASLNLAWSEFPLRVPAFP